MMPTLKELTEQEFGEWVDALKLMRNIYFIVTCTMLLAASMTGMLIGKTWFEWPQPRYIVTIIGLVIIWISMPTIRRWMRAFFTTEVMESKTIIEDMEVTFRLQKAPETET